MRIGPDKHFLLIEQGDSTDPYAPWRLDVIARGPGYNLSVTHERIVADTSDQTIEQFNKFANHQMQQVEVPLTEDGWLKFERQARGGISVHYRFGNCDCGSACEGSVHVDGEFAMNLYKEFGSLLKGSQ